ncbi:MAG: GNAT family N-acetyltransferase [Clostridiales bacterium]|nr:GNAT family N-acetyltransferase [Clostridiales bacterium]MBQ5422874.1 GNAT family N-acetyltransferase [Clostridiales bacterium]
MNVINYYECDNKEHWLEQIGRCDWRAGQYLHDLIRDGKLLDMIGADSKVLLLTEGDELISFCTLAEKDEIQPTDLKPWMGFIYTFPEYRGHRYLGKLFEAAGDIAKEEGFTRVYISTDHTGLYEKYGCEFTGEMQSIYGENCRVYVKDYV